MQDSVQFGVSLSLSIALSPSLHLPLAQGLPSKCVQMGWSSNLVTNSLMAHGTQMDSEWPEFWQLYSNTSLHGKGKNIGPTRTLLVAPGIATRNKNATRGSWSYY